MSYDRDKAWEMVAALLRSDGYDNHTAIRMEHIFLEFDGDWPMWATANGSAGLANAHETHRKMADVSRAMLKVGGFLRSINGIEVGDEQAD